MSSYGNSSGAGRGSDRGGYDQGGSYGSRGGYRQEGGSYGGGGRGYEGRSATSSHSSSPMPSGSSYGQQSGRADIRGYAAASREARSQAGGGQYTSKYGNGGTYGGSRYGSPQQQRQYGGQQQQQYEEDEDEDIDVIKSKIHDKKVETVESTRNALRMLQQSEEVGAKTLTKLGEQSEQLNRIERTMEMASIKAESSVEETSKLRTLNKSMFHVHIGNPFTRKKRREEELRKVMDKQERERLAHEREMESNSVTRNRVRDHADPNGPRFKGPTGRMDANGNVINTYNNRSKGERSKYTFEDDDDEIEDEIDDNLNEMSNMLGRLKGLAQATNSELTSQVDPMKRIMDTSNKTSDNIGMARHHLSQIK
ncbi:Protein transport protein S9 plasma membrane t-SNARE [Coemansia sp. Benny D115]|nr:Protein transport protein S9 plasma membrane t-SNARE [Coemansia sp. Benny D115]